MSGPLVVCYPQLRVPRTPQSVKRKLQTGYGIYRINKTLVHHRVGDGVVGADAQGEGADGRAGVALLVLSQ